MNLRRSRSSQNLLARLEQTYDAIPRAGGADIEAVGPFELFTRRPPAWPYYARPRLGVTDFTVADVDAVRARQRELGVPEAIEWVHDVTPALLSAVRDSGLPVLEAPLMVLEPDRLPAPRTDLALRRLDPDAPDFAADFATSTAVAKLGFGADHTDVAEGGPAERDAVEAPDPGLVERVAEGLRSGRTAEAVLTTDEGIVARAALQSALRATEIVGVATLPALRRRGYGAAVSAFLARYALDRGDELVFLSANGAAVARIYASIGFHRVGTACIAEPSH